MDKPKSPQEGADVTLKFNEKPANGFRLALRYDLEDIFMEFTDILVDDVVRGASRFFEHAIRQFRELA